jgi:hypothetical protein
VAYAKAISFIARNFVASQHAIAVPKDEDILIQPIAVVAAGPWNTVDSWVGLLVLLAMAEVSRHSAVIHSLTLLHG